MDHRGLIYNSPLLRKYQLGYVRDKPCVLLDPFPIHQRDGIDDWDGYRNFHIWHHPTEKLPLSDLLGHCLLGAHIRDWNIGSGLYQWDERVAIPTISCWQFNRCIVQPVRLSTGNRNLSSSRFYDVCDRFSAILRYANDCTIPVPEFHGRNRVNCAATVMHIYSHSDQR